MTKAETKRMKELVETIARTKCISTMLTGINSYEDNLQRCGCVVHMARQALRDDSQQTGDSGSPAVFGERGDD